MEHGDSSDSDESTVTYQEVTKPVKGTLDAHMFMCSVAIQFGKNSFEYAEFLRISNDFGVGRSCIKEFQVKMLLLLKEHPDLLADLHTFLPAGYEIPMPVQKDDLVSRAVEFEEEVNFVNKVKEECLHDRTRYKSFLNIMTEYHTTEMSVMEVYEELCRLFDYRPDLVAEFRKFLLDSSDSMATKAVHQSKLNQRSKSGKRSRILFCSIALFLLLSVLYTFGLGIRL
ncbi:Paired amphipathic helix protein Sin3-like [Actinidia chinensis var. chinensis]|uniref:Paired amphipathic helix protein Sin3-like n=1 Tax=Actinidia chinensis var. chinensis TaxID=1590841 RepID=A0A2R6PE32_ACTCC|nr:Paired amphipathic helix protein Sin3-like [Actinidia chinensis var. chinensis]